MATRMFTGPALRVQPDGRLVRLVRAGSEPAFEEIVRRYGTALQRYAAAIVTSNRAEDVTQDAFTKAYIALKGTGKEITLKPWLYRIVRNTALNELRDAPPKTGELDERAIGGEEPLDTIERREQVESLMAGLSELPEPQRAAIVMRELEGLSHEQIAKSLGVSGGAVRQSIYRARTSLRNGLGMMVPLPLLRTLALGATPDGAAGGVAAGGAGAGIGIAAKAGLATLLVAGTGAAGVAIDHHKAEGPVASHGVPAPITHGGSIVAGSLPGDDNSGRGGGGDGHSGREDGGNDNSGKGSSSSGSGRSGSGDGSSGSSGSGSSGSGTSGSGSSGSSGSGSSGSSGSGSSGSGSSGSGSGDSGSGGSGSGGGDDGIFP
jgi:RNA polymerase sigma factor (sigma-70 family)